MFGDGNLSRVFVFTRVLRRTTSLAFSSAIFPMVHIVNDSIDPKRRGDYVFTPERANLMLPLVRRIASDVLKLKSIIDGQDDQLRGLDRLSSDVVTDRPEFADELRDVRESLASNQRRMKELLGELAELGISTHETIDGCFDFPAVVGRRPAFLCWNPQEPSVLHWHDAVSERRLPIDGTVFEACPN